MADRAKTGPYDPFVKRPVLKPIGDPSYERTYERVFDRRSHYPFPNGVVPNITRYDLRALAFP